jgi:carbon monoxide dehydrogenase subunit G
MIQIERSREIDATPDRLWEVLADFGALASWVPMIQHTCPLSEQTEGVGTVRRVQVQRQTLVETVTIWTPPTTLAYTIEGLPPIAGVPVTTWRLTPQGPSTSVTVSTELDTGRNPVRVLVGRKVLERLGLAAEFMLAGLAERVGSAS